MPHPTSGTSLPCPLPDWQECLKELLEEHRRRLIADIALQLKPVHQMLKNGNLRPSGLKVGEDLPFGIQNSSNLTPVPEVSPSGLKGCEDLLASMAQVSVKSKPASRVQSMSERMMQKFDSNNRTKSSIRPSCSAPAQQVKDVVAEVQLDFKDEKQEKKWQLISMLDIIIAVVISMNVAFMIVELQNQSYRSKVILGIVKEEGAWKNAEQWFEVVEHLFNAVYPLEIILRFWVLRIKYFESSMNILDLVLVLLSTLQIYVLEPLHVSSGGHMTLFRMFRFFRLVRVLKILRLKMFTALRVLVQTCISSMAALAWSMVLLFVIIIMSGIFLCYLLNLEMQDTSRDNSLRMWLFRYYGTPLRATYTLFEVTMSGCWPNYFRPLIERLNGWYALYVLSYISIVVFAVIRIITAIFLEQTLSVASNDADMVIIEQKTKTQQTIQKFAKVFNSLDSSHDGLLHREEFEVIISNPEVRGWLSNLDVMVHDAEGLFQLLDDGDGAITYEEFLAGMMRLKGHAKSLDLVALSRHCDKIEDTVLSVEAKVDFIVDTFRRLQS